MRRRKKRSALVSPLYDTMHLIIEINFFGFVMLGVSSRAEAKRERESKSQPDTKT